MTFEAQDGIGKTKFKQDFGRHPKTPRALMKVALGTLALQLGPEAACSPRYDPVRDFVINGKGSFKAMMRVPSDAPGYFLGVSPPQGVSGYEVAILVILGVTFLVDFDPQQRGVAHVLATMESSPDNTWITLGS